MSDDLVSVRGLVDSDFDLPVREFDGVFAGYETEPASGYEGTRVKLLYGDIDNVVAVSPYNLPTVTLNMGLSNKRKSRFGYYGDSLGQLEPTDEDINMQDGKIWAGQRHHVVFCDGLDGRPEPKPIWSRDAGNAWKRYVQVEIRLSALESVLSPTAEEQQEMSNLKEEIESMEEVYRDGMVPTPVWIVASVDGVSAGGTENDAVSTVEWAEQNIVGKTRAEFNKWFYADPKCRKDTVLTRAVSDKSFVTSLIQMERIEEDENGVFRVPVAAE